MYGIVQQALEALVRNEHGDDAWRRVLARVGHADEPFVGMQNYPDDLSYGLVGAICEETGRSAEDVMISFGRAWVRHTSAQFDDLLRGAGSTLPELLRSLDRLHTRVQLSYPELRPPSFRVTDETDDSLRLHYESTRAGLAPMILGLVAGLGERFDVPVTISVTDAPDASHASFLVRWGRAAAEST